MRAEKLAAYGSLAVLAYVGYQGFQKSGGTAGVKSKLKAGVVKAIIGLFTYPAKDAFPSLYDANGNPTVITDPDGRTHQAGVYDLPLDQAQVPFWNVSGIDVLPPPFGS